MRMRERSLRRARNIAAAFAVAGIGVLVWGFGGIDERAPVNPVTVITERLSMVVADRLVGSAVAWMLAAVTLDSVIDAAPNG